MSFYTTIALAVALGILLLRLGYNSANDNPSEPGFFTEVLPVILLVYVFYKTVLNPS
jgi:Na+/H+ antiporter NhaC